MFRALLTRRKGCLDASPTVGHTERTLLQVKLENDVVVGDGNLVEDHHHDLKSPGRLIGVIFPRCPHGELKPPVYTHHANKSPSTFPNGEWNGNFLYCIQ